jgi:apolipoprotein D and lipocalin family protein
MKLTYFMTLGILCTLGQFATSTPSTARELPDLKVVSQLDLNRYLGKWYEMAAIPQFFQKNCVAATATYSLKDDDSIVVFNECRKKDLNGKIKSIKGKAWIPNPQEPAKLKVQFFWPFSGDYWVIDLGEHYEYAVVGNPTREYFWILSRTPKIDETLYEEILARARDQGYDTSKIMKTLQVNE